MPRFYHGIVRPMAMTRPRGDELLGALGQVVGPDRVSARASDRATYGRDMWPRLLLTIREGQPLPHAPDAVVWPETPEEVAAIVSVCRGLGVPVVPYGAGSGVCGGAVPVHGGVTIDVKRLDHFGGVDGEDFVCTAGAGINGEHLERALSRAGYTLGHFPSSIYCSTLGGWLAARSAGQLSTRYGKIEDMVTNVTMVTGRGDIIETARLGRAGAGPDWTQLVVGSEGTLGVITSAKLRVHPAPEARILRGFECRDLAQGLIGVRRMLQAGLRPAVVRLYDPFDSQIAFRKHGPEVGTTEPQAPGLPSIPGPDDPDQGLLDLLKLALPGATGRSRRLKANLLDIVLRRPAILNRLAGTISERVGRRGCLLILGVEGTTKRATVEAEACCSEMLSMGARDLGPGPGERWLSARYAMSYGMSKVYEAGAFVDTMEVAATWDRLRALYEGVRAAISRHAFVMAHFSHAYPDGCSIYFTFVGHGRHQAEAEARYDAIWKDALGAAHRAGGTIAHHHGVGLLKAPFMNEEHGEAMQLYRAVKQAFDPDGIMNPGKMGLT